MTMSKNEQHEAAIEALDKGLEMYYEWLCGDTMPMPDERQQMFDEARGLIESLKSVPKPESLSDLLGQIDVKDAEIARLLDKLDVVTGAKRRREEAQMLLEPFSVPPDHWLRREYGSSPFGYLPALLCGYCHGTGWHVARLTEEPRRSTGTKRCFKCGGAGLGDE